MPTLKRKQKYAVGTVFGLRTGGTIRVMAYAEGYYMMRRKGASPFLIHESDFINRIRKINGIEPIILKQP